MEGHGDISTEEMARRMADGMTGWMNEIMGDGEADWAHMAGFLVTQLSEERKTGERIFTKNLTEVEAYEVEQEMALFQIQDRLASARVKAFRQSLDSKRAEFEEKIRVARIDFENQMKRAQDFFVREEAKLCHQNFVSHVLKIKEQGVQETRKRTIPAYTFTRFSELPSEIQSTIWSIATRSEDSRLHVFSRRRTCDHDENGSSRINLAREPQSIGESIPAVLHICSASRKVAQEVYTKLPFSTGHGCEPRRETYFNTLYDQFYIENTDSWEKNKIIVDILMQSYPPSLLSLEETTDLALFQKIRNLALDFAIFAVLPPMFFAVFKALTRLTIVLYPFYINDNIGIANTYTAIEFVPPPKCSRYSRRAKWLLTKALALLKPSADRIVAPENALKVDVVLRKTGSPTLDAVFDFDFMNHTKDELNNEDGNLASPGTEVAIEDIDEQISSDDFEQLDPGRYAMERDMEMDDYCFDNIWWYKRANTALESTISETTVAGLRTKYPLLRNPPCPP